MARTLPTGCARSSPLPTLTQATVGITIGSPDYIILTSAFKSGICRRIYCNASGTVSVSRSGDLDDDGTTKIFTAYTVAAGTILEGEFTAIAGTGGSSPASTAIAIVLEQ